jgi:glycosyltransferase involved in cell wall biosynthesis
MNKKVSVIVATYHRDETLKKALKSLAEQSYPEMEIVLVDDNAAESWNKKVRDIVECFQKEFPSCQLLYMPNEVNLGSAKTRNRGIENASGEYITFLDDDDEYLPNKIENQVCFMQENQLLAMRMRRVYKNENVVFYSIPGTNHGTCSRPSLAIINDILCKVSKNNSKIKE